MNNTNIIDLISLLFQVIGSGILFFNSPINEPKGMIVNIENPDYNKLEKRNKKSKLGFSLITIGLLIHFFHLLVKSIQ